MPRLRYWKQEKWLSNFWASLVPAYGCRTLPTRWMWSVSEKYAWVTVADTICLLPERKNNCVRSHLLMHCFKSLMILNARHNRYSNTHRHNSLHRLETRARDATRHNYRTMDTRDLPHIDRCCHSRRRQSDTERSPCSSRRRRWTPNDSWGMTLHREENGTNLIKYKCVCYAKIPEQNYCDMQMHVHVSLLLLSPLTVSLEFCFRLDLNLTSFTHDSRSARGRANRTKSAHFTEIIGIKPLWQIHLYELLARRGFKNTKVGPQILRFTQD